jgi:hypothetical protein
VQQEVAAWTRQQTRDGAATKGEEEMEVTDAMATTEKDAAGVGTVAAGWEDEDDETGIEDCVGQQELGASVDNRRWCDKRRRRTVNKQMVS